MKVLITGFAGFIMGHLTESLLEDDIVDLVGIDCLGIGSDDELPDALLMKSMQNKHNFSYHIGSVSDRDFVRAVLEKEKPDYIIHGAAETHVDRSIEDPEGFLKTNVMGTEVLLSECGRLTKFLYISTDEVYGDVTGMSNESTVLRPSSPYSASKAAAEMLVMAHTRTFGVPGVIVRMCNVFGPRQFREKLIPKTIYNIVHNEKIGLYGDGQQLREWMYVQDAVSGIKAALLNGITGEVYNLADPYEAHTNLELVSQICRLLGKDPESFISYTIDRLGHDKRYCNSSSKANDELAWQLKRGFTENLRETVQWYKSYFSM